MSEVARTSEVLHSGHVYTRAELRQRFDIRDATLNNGIFQPSGHSSVWLFVTERKTSDRTQYVDRLDGDLLHWQGQTLGRKDSLIIEHEQRGLELLVFYRQRKYEYPHAGFRLEGVFRYSRHWGSQPTNFELRRVELPVGGGASGHAEGTSSDAAPDLESALGGSAGPEGADAPYVDVASSRQPAVPEGLYSYDPDLHGQGALAHQQIQTLLAQRLSELGLEPRSPATPAIAFDVLWRQGGKTFVAEVKSLSSTNEERQLRLGLGQVLRYRHSLSVVGEPATAVLVVERRPSDPAWVDLCDELGVDLIWPSMFSSMTLPHA